MSSRERAPQKSRPAPFTGLGPCPASGDQAREAKKSIAELDASLAAHQPGDSADALNQWLDGLLDHPCLKWQRAIGNEPEKAASVAAFRAFWDHGGRRWLSASVARAEDERVVWVPPAMPELLDRESAPDHPLRELLLCPRADPACGAETRGWRARAEAAIAAATEPDPPAPDAPSCAELVADTAAPERLEHFVSCERSGLPRAPAFPVSGLRALDRGWLILGGRRGHYGFCDGLHAYDLATGSVYFVDSCSKLFLKSGGNVDHGATDAARVPQARVGQLPLSNVREAAWMTVVAPYLHKQVRRDGARIEVPAEIPLSVGAEDAGFGVLGVSDWMTSSAQTTLRWHYVVDGETLVSGTLRWPVDYNNAAANHAAQLWTIAEAGLREGCASARLPADLPVGQGAVSRLDADPALLAKQHGALAAAMGELRRRKPCR